MVSKRNPKARLSDTGRRPRLPKNEQKEDRAAACGALQSHPRRKKGDKDSKFLPASKLTCGLIAKETVRVWALLFKRTMSGKGQGMVYTLIQRVRMNWQDPSGNNFNSIQHEPSKCNFGSVNQLLGIYLKEIIRKALTSLYKDTYTYHRKQEWH